MAQGKLTLGEIDVSTKVKIGQEELTDIKVKDIENSNFKIRNSEKMLQMLDKISTRFPTINIDMKEDNGQIVNRDNPLGKVPINKFNGNTSVIIESGNNPKIRGNGGWTSITGTSESCNWKIWDSDEFYGTGTADTRLKASDFEFAYFTLLELKPYKYAFRQIPKLIITIKDTSNNNEETIEYEYNVQNNMYLNEVEGSDAITFVASPELEKGVVDYLNALSIQHNGNWIDLYDNDLETGQPFPYDTVGNVVKQTYHSGLDIGSVSQTVAETSDFFGIFDVNNTMHMRPFASSGSWRSYPLINFNTTEFKDKILNASDNKVIKNISISIDNKSYFTLSSAGVKFNNQTLQTIHFKDHKFTEASQRLQYKYPKEWDEFMTPEHKVNNKVTFPLYYTTRSLLHNNNILRSGNFDDYTVTNEHINEFNPSAQSVAPVFSFEFRDCMLFYIDETESGKQTIGKFNFSLDNGTMEEINVDVMYNSHDTLDEKNNDPTQRIGMYKSAENTGNNWVYITADGNYTPIPALKWGTEYKVDFILLENDNSYGDVRSISFTNFYGWDDHSYIMSGTETGFERKQKVFIGVDKPVPMVFNNTYPTYFIPTGRFSAYLIPSPLESVSTETLTEIGNWVYQPFNSANIAATTLAWNLGYDSSPIDGSNGFNGNLTDEDDNLITIFRECYSYLSGQTKLSGEHYYVHNNLTDTARPSLSPENEFASVKSLLT